MKTKVINLFAGAGCGKSTIASQLFAEMKWKGLSVELVNEAAKEMTWEKHHNLLADQLYVSAMQNRKLERLRGQVEYIITDSPLLLCQVYAETYHPSFQQTIRDIFDTYDNINYRFIRHKPYNPNGRNQTEQEAIEIDRKIRTALLNGHVNHTIILGDRYAADRILEQLGLS